MPGVPYAIRGDGVARRRTQRARPKLIAAFRRSPARFASASCRSPGRWRQSARGMISSQCASSQSSRYSMGLPRIPSIFRPSSTASPDARRTDPEHTPPHAPPRRPKNRGLGALLDLPRLVRGRRDGASTSMDGPAIGAQPASPPAGFKLPRQNALNAEGIRALERQFPPPRRAPRRAPYCGHRHRDRRPRRIRSRPARWRSSCCGANRFSPASRPRYPWRPRHPIFRWTPCRRH